MLRDKMQKDAADAKRRAEKHKEQLLATENLLETLQSMKRYTPIQLGDGSPAAGGAAARKNRFEVLDRLARLGIGLSAEQKNDWSWFKKEWDDEMVAQHGVSWESTFAAWMQEVLDKIQAESSDAMTQFVYNETLRCFSESFALVVPGASCSN